MGYETSFKLIRKEDDNFLENLETFSDYEWWDYYDEAYQLDAKWYDYQKDMIKLSKIYKHEIFELRGEGEESGDIWVHYFKNGKSVRYTPEIKFPEFKKEDLK